MKHTMIEAAKILGVVFAAWIAFLITAPEPKVDQPNLYSEESEWN